MLCLEESFACNKTVRSLCKWRSAQQGSFQQNDVRAGIRAPVTTATTWSTNHYTTRTGDTDEEAGKEACYPNRSRQLQQSERCPLED